MAAENPTLGATETRPVGGMWDPDAALLPLAPAPRRALRAVGVAAVWALGVLPSAFGWQRCTVATVLHRPCPGCGMTRAVRLLGAGHVEASLQMHPLAVPALAAWMMFMAATVWATWTQGTPLAALKLRLGRVTLIAIVVVYVASAVLWALRWFGLFGGPVPV
jgi:hypothetical protein